MQLRHVSMVLLGGKTAIFATKCISFSSAGLLAACHNDTGYYAALYNLFVGL